MEKKQAKKKTIFILVVSSVCEMGADLNTYPFNSKEGAQKKMEELYPLDLSEFPDKERTIINKDDNGYEIYEKSNYHMNHIIAQIDEKELA